MCATCGCSKTAKKSTKKASAKKMIGNQSKLDMNKNGKLDKKDFMMLSKKKKAK
jgi:hypothetical protein